jgi:hypothetical protein
MPLLLLMMMIVMVMVMVVIDDEDINRAWKIIVKTIEIQSQRI